MIETDSKLSDLSTIIKRFPQAIINVKVSKKPPLSEFKSIQKAIKDAEDQLGENGLVLVRYSGTESICRVTVQGSKQKQVHQLAEMIAQEIKQVLG